jgi:hypothetical protein
VAGRARGVRGLWVELRHRRRQPHPEAEAPEQSEVRESVDAVDAVEESGTSTG